MGTIHGLRRALAAGALLITGMLAGSLAPGPAHAMLGGCMTDPFVILSNGQIMHLYAYLPQTELGNVQSVSYALVLPAGTTVVVQVGTDGLLGAKEHFEFAATNPPNTYDTTTVVRTTNPGDPATATSSIGLTSRSTTGQVYQSLAIHLAPGQ